MAEKTTPPSCCQCCTAALAICVTCTRHFCWLHLSQHRQTYEKYLDDINQPLSVCLNEFDRIEIKLRSDIDQWEKDTIQEVKDSADQTRRTLDAYINIYRAHFDEESANLRDVLSTCNRDALLNRLEKLQIEYGRSLSELCLVKLHNQGHMLDIEIKNATKEQVAINRSSQIAPQESDHYVAQTSLGDRLIKEPLAKTSVGSYWAMDGSNEQLLIQEYQTQQLTLFDSNGNRGVSIIWHHDTIIRDIHWYEESQRFFILLDKKLILFDPVTKDFQEIIQVKPHQTNGYRRCACSHDRLFIAYWGQESSIELFQISTWEVKHHWFSPVTCRVNELISAIRLNSLDQLGLCIQDENNPLRRKFRFEIRDIALNILHTLPLYADSGIFSRMVALPDLHWAILNVDENYVFVVNQNGELIDRIEWPRGTVSNIALIGNKIIVIRSVDKIYLYDVAFQQNH